MTTTLEPAVAQACATLLDSGTRAAAVAEKALDDQEVLQRKLQQLALVASLQAEELAREQATTDELIASTQKLQTLLSTVLPAVSEHLDGYEALQQAYGRLSRAIDEKFQAERDTMAVVERDEQGRLLAIREVPAPRTPDGSMTVRDFDEQLAELLKGIDLGDDANGNGAT